MDNAMDAYWQAPPIARNLATAVLAATIGTTLGLLPANQFFFHPFYLWRFPPQIWRILTCFLITGPQMGILFDTYFLYRYLSMLEVGNPRFSRKEDVIWYLMFVGGTILTINSAIGLPFFQFLHALILAVCYTVTQDQRGMKANFYFINIPAQLTPYCMIAINLLFPGGPMMMLLQAEGLVAAHLYDFLTRIWPQFGGSGRSLIPTPAVLTTAVNAVSRWTSRAGVAAPPRGAGAGASTGSATGASRGPLPDSWRSRGPGHRLG
ncbi:Derlin-like protein [Hapsidospora chrysogenum ATCC 11550]|uniref:Derlin n=1 Tax=Hapsidospora chrysogenum (strain ATCC 11550 / CBS 779.69 / DSM 880 / IAM 14645 / JCM 23072 / IMI 49137) TaxID=857340 RepID=A0A086TE99_HAPC1|nr:Derlin-like protein [Hapsidospora chrysogenum ATCC 11550]